MTLSESICALVGIHGNQAGKSVVVVVAGLGTVVMGLSKKFVVVVVVVAMADVEKEGVVVHEMELPKSSCCCSLLLAVSHSMLLDGGAEDAKSEVTSNPKTRGSSSGWSGRMGKVDRCLDTVVVDEEDGECKPAICEMGR